jgi:hypothetical protein
MLQIRNVIGRLYREIGCLAGNDAGHQIDRGDQ